MTATQPPLVADEATALRGWLDLEAALADPDRGQPRPGLGAQGRGVASGDLRWMLLHLIEEYARHNGHADLIRQSIDGSVGE